MSKLSYISMKLVVVLFALCSLVYVDAKVFTRCQLAQELLKQGFPRSQLPDWVCLVENESSRSTSKIGGPNKNKSFDYGLFQINDKYWCKKGTKGGDCKVDCNDLLKDDITIASACAKIIFKRHNFNAWYGWLNKCKGKTLPNLDACFP